MIRCIFLLVMLASLFQCVSELEDPVDTAIYGHDYYPLALGDSRIYQVDSVQFDLDVEGNPTRDSSRYFIRELVVEDFENELGETIYRVQIYRAASAAGPWAIDGVATRSRTNRQAHYMEGNVRFINLVFPLEEGTSWDGNAFIPDDMVVFIRGESLQMFSNWEYKVLSENLSETIGGRVYDEVATVQQVDVENAIERRFSIEKYAKQIGLIYREREMLDSSCKYTGDLGPCIGKTWSEKAGRGFRLVERLVDHN
ncbi:MAG: hypothetical protein HKN87_15135 [Saprospiraceae bacterium]|nr:hypothetical protein [Saprospiraceae bacterium]